MSDAIYVLRDTRGNLGSNAMFLAVGGSYTSNLDNAERFTKDEALRQHKCRNTDQPLPLSLLQPMMNNTVDHQHLPNANFNSAEHTLFVVQINRKWDGNDIYFYNADSASNSDERHTTNLSNATIYTYSGAMQVTLKMDAQLWPLNWMKSISRPVVRAKDIADAIKRAELAALEQLTA